ncbi:unnamed protein product [Didymodactylos carnosus]|uniref:BTB domain-containing protein n=1 Tax=Didymodactylos carnosus TaxID=1234261 RepID=A0A813RJZ8_9BILA|nr:unnamed protein product [Didymodactylos carnosus]CAF0805358.1 unnamed protein product [Didymodactylos carnosus]CAF3568911.1 unnamed protein product [Didymodactylos carnosus]CAF3589013.1 unnamed protein product [Didymodactylos carnosus]
MEDETYFFPAGNANSGLQQEQCFVTTNHSYDYDKNNPPTTNSSLKYRRIYNPSKSSSTSKILNNEHDGTSLSSDSGCWSDELLMNCCEPFDKVVINISGLRFETRSSTLNRYPLTLLGNTNRRSMYFDFHSNEYFFERHRSSFESVLYFYQSQGRLIRPDNVPSEIFLEEIKFFDLGEEVLKRYRKQEGYIDEKQIERPSNAYQHAVWEVFECPESSRLARVVAIISIVMITVSIATFIIETLPFIRNDTNLIPTRNTTLLNSNNENSIVQSETRYFWVFFIIETICVTWFCFEVICRFLVAPSKVAFLKNAPNVIDIVSIIPYFLQLIGLIYQKKDSNVSGFSSTLTVLRIGLQVLALTFLASWKELLLLIGGVTNKPQYVGTTSFNNQDQTNQFLSIPHSFWFAIITMTTVGYGDIVPRTNIGKVIGAACALTGVLTIALPVPIIVSNFTYFYQRQMEDNERQYQAKKGPQANVKKSGGLSEREKGPELNEWELVTEPDYHDYREITHAVTKRLVRNSYFKAFRGSKRITPTSIMNNSNRNYQTLNQTTFASPQNNSSNTFTHHHPLQGLSRSSATATATNSRHNHYPIHEKSALETTRLLR